MVVVVVVGAVVVEITADTVADGNVVAAIGGPSAVGQECGGVTVNGGPSEEGRECD